MTNSARYGRIFLSVGHQQRKGFKAMTKNLQNAINKARSVKCAVKVLGKRIYLVITPQQRRYTVRFEMHNGERYGICSCKAGAFGMACYHLPKAALVDTGLQSLMAQ